MELLHRHVLGLGLYIHSLRSLRAHGEEGTEPDDIYYTGDTECIDLRGSSGDDNGLRAQHSSAKRAHAVVGPEATAGCHSVGLRAGVCFDHFLGTVMFLAL